MKKKAKKQEPDTPMPGENKSAKNDADDLDLGDILDLSLPED